MDALTSNNLSRGLAALAGTVGEYATMEHQERMEGARQQFNQMLANQKQTAEDKRAQDANATRVQLAQASSDKADARLKDQIASREKMSSAEITARSSDRAATIAAQNARAAARLEARTAKTAGGAKPPTQTSLMNEAKAQKAEYDKAYAAFQTAKDQTGPAAKQAGAAYGVAYNNMANAYKKAGLQVPPYSGADGPSYPQTSGAPAPSPAAAPAPASQPAVPPGMRVLKGPKGLMLYDPKTQKMTPFGAPTADASDQTTDDTQDDSQTADTQPQQAAPAQVAQTAPPAAPDPTQPPTIGQPDPNNPQLAS